MYNEIVRTEVTTTTMQVPILGEWKREKEKEKDEKVFIYICMYVYMYVCLCVCNGRR